MSPHRIRAGLLFVIIAAFQLSWSNSSAQEASGSTLAAVAGGALGTLSGATLGLTGSLVPCTQTYYGATCVRWSAFTGGAIGFTSGILIGNLDSERIESAAASAGIGTAAGLVSGLVVSQFAQRFGWADVATVGLLGGAVGAMPKGSAIGFVAGGAAGAVLWWVVPGFHLPDAVGTAVAGLALGSLTQWVWSAADANSNAVGEAQVVLPLIFRF